MRQDMYSHHFSKHRDIKSTWTAHDSKLLVKSSLFNWRTLNPSSFFPSKGVLLRELRNAYIPCTAHGPPERKYRARLAKTRLGICSSIDVVCVGNEAEAVEFRWLGIILSICHQRILRNTNVVVGGNISSIREGERRYDFPIRTTYVDVIC